MDEKKLKALATELAKGLKTEADLNQFSRMLTKLTVETALNTELTSHPGHEKNTQKKAQTPVMATCLKRCSVMTARASWIRLVTVKTPSNLS